MFARPIGMVGLALLCVCIASPQKKNALPNIPTLPKQVDHIMTINPPGSSDWRPASANPKLLLAKCDAWIAQLQNVSGKTIFDWAAGDNDPWGQNQGDIAIVNSHMFRADIVHFDHQKDGIMQQPGRVVANGSRFQILDQDGFHPTRSVTSPRLPKNLLAVWPQLAQDLIFTEFGANEHPLSALYRAAVAAGLHVVTEKRTYTFRGITARQFRVVFKGNTVLAGKRTRLEEEILIDAPTGALVKLTQYRQSGNDVKSRFRSFWTVRWNRTEGQAFDQALFALAPPTLHRSLSAAAPTGPNRSDSR